MISAEAAYQSANAGYYDVPDCLWRPRSPSAWARTRRRHGFITPGCIVFDVPKTGYVLRFYPGETVSAPGASPSSLSAFAVVAAPASAQGGVRTFCGDSTGVVCTLSVGGFGATGEDAATGGRCPESCPPLR